MNKILTQRLLQGLEYSRRTFSIDWVMQTTDANFWCSQTVKRWLSNQAAKMTVNLKLADPGLSCDYSIYGSDTHPCQI